MSDLNRKEKMKARKKAMKDRSEGGNMIFIKADETIRVRPLPVDESEEFGLEVTQFYFGGDVKGVISAATFGEPCPIIDMYEKLKKGDDDDQDLAKKLKPKKKYVIPVVLFDDLKGKKINKQKSGKLLLLTSGTAQNLIDYFLDEEQGDFTHPKNGYDLKITRTGSTMMDTEYSVVPCKPTKLDKEYNKIWDVEAMVRKDVKTEEEAETILNNFLNISPEDKPKKKKGKKDKNKKEKEEKPEKKKDKKGKKK